MNKTTKVITALGVTAAIGALLGVLYAPDKGKRTRRKLAREYGRLLYTMDDKLDNSRDQIDRLQEKIEELRKHRN